MAFPHTHTYIHKSNEIYSFIGRHGVTKFSFYSRGCVLRVRDKHIHDRKIIENVYLFTQLCVCVCVCVKIDKRSFMDHQTICVSKQETMEKVDTFLCFKHKFLLCDLRKFPHMHTYSYALQVYDSQHRHLTLF